MHECFYVRYFTENSSSPLMKAKTGRGGVRMQAYGLFPGEVVGYSTLAAWCGAPLRGSRFYRYQVKDQGTLLFTDLRMIYLGRRARLVMGYEHLVRVSCLHGALAFLADNWTQSERFEVPYLADCACHVETILTNFKHNNLYRLSREAIGELETLHIPTLK
jgi:hypothetical protein